MSFRPYIKDMGLKSGVAIRPYGSSRHDSLRISLDGRTLSYENLQNGDGSKYGCYRFCDEEGRTPEEDPDMVKYGADAYFNIGGFASDDDKEATDKVIEALKKIKEEMDNKGWYNRHDKEQFAEILDKHISRLKGELNE